MCVTICGRFHLDEGAAAGYGNRIRVKYTAKWGVRLREKQALAYYLRKRKNAPLLTIFPILLHINQQHRNIRR